MSDDEIEVLADQGRSPTRWELLQLQAEIARRGGGFLGRVGALFQRISSFKKASRNSATLL